MMNNVTMEILIHQMDAVNYAKLKIHMFATWYKGSLNAFKVKNQS